MALIPWRPGWLWRPWEDWEDIDKWFEERWPEIKTAEFMPPVDIYEKDNKIIAEVEIPGVKPEDINIEVTDNLLKVEAKTKEEKEEKERDYYRKEIGKRYFKRIIALPVDVKGNEAVAECEDGVLRIEIPKVKKKEEPKKIKVKVKAKKSK